MVLAMVEMESPSGPAAASTCQAAAFTVPTPKRDGMRIPLLEGMPAGTPEPGFRCETGLRIALPEGTPRIGTRRLSPVAQCFRRDVAESRATPVMVCRVGPGDLGVPCQTLLLRYRWCAGVANGVSRGRRCGTL
eukprot:8532699-Pyramimonas_sp.AAC.1